MRPRASLAVTSIASRLLCRYLVTVKFEALVPVPAEVITEIGPVFGVKPLTTGAGITVKLSALVAIPAGVVTEIGPLAAPCGTIAIIRALEQAYESRSFAMLILREFYFNSLRSEPKFQAIGRATGLF